jgi:hypothetical protein
LAGISTAAKGALAVEEISAATKVMALRSR